MTLKTLAFMAIIAAVIVAGLLFMHGDAGGALHDWLRAMHGSR
jgi:hypothetical protein